MNIAITIVDYSIALAHFKDEKKVLSAFKLLSQNLSKEKKELLLAQDRADWRTVYKIIHSLKSATLICGLSQLHEACLKFEMAWKAKQENLFPLTDCLLVEIEQVHDAINKIIETNIS